MVKYNRIYQLQIQSAVGSSEFITIELPTTVEFDIVRKSESDCNYSTIRVYNLGLVNRNLIQFDQYINGEQRQIQLLAGYGDPNNLHTLFIGQATRAWSVREGTDFITEIHALDGGDAYLHAIIDGDASDAVFQAGTPYQNVINYLMQKLTSFNISKGYIGTYGGIATRGYVAAGNIIDQLAELTGGGFCIDNGVAYCLNPGDTVQYQSGTSQFTVTNSTTVPLLNNSSGLLGTPMRQDQWLTFDMIFEPKLSLFQLIKLETQTGNPNYQGLYKVLSLRHKGMISGAVCGDAVTTVGVNYGVTFKAAQEVQIVR